MPPETKILAFLPLVSFAAMSQAVASLIGRINDQLLNPLIFLLIAVALLVFLWNLVKLLSTADGDAISKAKGKIMWSLIGLVIMISVVGIMNIVIDTWTSLR
jgi:uncharacterized membrane protein